MSARKPFCVLMTEEGCYYPICDARKVFAPSWLVHQRTSNGNLLSNRNYNVTNSVFFSSKIMYTCSGNVDLAEALNASAEVRMPESYLALIRSLSPDELLPRFLETIWSRLLIKDLAFGPH